MREAVIVLLPKPGKDLTCLSSYSPISLLPVDVKLLAKLLASRLSRVVQEVIHLIRLVLCPTSQRQLNSDVST